MRGCYCAVPQKITIRSRECRYQYKFLQLLLCFLDQSDSPNGGGNVGLRVKQSLEGVCEANSKSLVGGQSVGRYRSIASKAEAWRAVDLGPRRSAQR